MQSILSFLPFVEVASAQAPMSLIPPSGSLAAGCNFVTGDIHFHCIPLYIGYLIQFMLGMAGGFFLFGIMIAGYKYMFGSITAAGMESGKKELIGRIVGFAIIVFSYLMVDIIIELLT